MANQATSVFDVLQARGFVEQMSDEASLREALAEGPVTVYTGYDPTADSLHIGHLIPTMALAHFQRAGHRVIAIVGGATGMIGDPSGRSDERNLLTAAQIEHNVACVKAQLERFLDVSDPARGVVLNNHDWIGRMSFIDWLRGVGKHFGLGYMLGKESVRSRLSSERGISYTEFSYMTLQAYDFLHLAREQGCTMQCGGNDQWGNITAGIDLARKVLGKQVHGMTYPLLTKSDGSKFGKTAGGSVWLDAARTSPFKFYQYWIQVEDADVERLLKFFTFLPLDVVAEVVAEHAASPHLREGQKRLAAEVTRLVHGEAGLASALRATAMLFGGEIAGLSDAELGDIFADVPSGEVARERLAAGIKMADLLVESGAAPSKAEARRLLDGGGVYVNNARFEDASMAVSEKHLASESMLVLRLGKKRQHVVRFTG